MGSRGLCIKDGNVMMNVLWPHAYYKPEKMSSSKLDSDLERAIIEDGNRLIITTPTPTRGCTDQERAKYSKIKYATSERLEIIRFPLMKEKQSTIQRFVRYIIGNIKQYNVSKKCRNVDLVFADSTPPTQGVMAALLAKKLKVPFIFAIHDVFPDSLVSAGLTDEGSMIWRIGRWIEKCTYDRADKIIAISEGIKCNLLNKGVPKEKIEVVNNWIDVHEVFYVPKNKNVLFDELGLDKNHRYLVYAGNLGQAQNIDLILDTAQLLKEYPIVQFLIFGSGGEEEVIKRSIREKGINNVRLFPLQPIDRVKEVYSLGEACFVLCKKGFGTSAMPSKTWSIMATGRPVIASFDLDGELSKLIQSNECGYCCPPDDAQALAESIKLLLSRRVSETSKYGFNAREYVVRNCDRETCCKAYIDIFKSQVH